MKLPGIHCPERVQDTKRKCLFSWDSFESMVTSSSLAQWWVSFPVIQGAGVRLPRGEAMFPVFNCTERESCCFVSLFLLFCFMSNSCMLVYQCVHQASKGLQMGIHGRLLSGWSYPQRGGSKCAHLALEIFQDLAVGIFICWLRWWRCCLCRNRPWKALNGPQILMHIRLTWVLLRGLGVGARLQ